MNTLISSRPGEAITAEDFHSLIAAHPVIRHPFLSAFAKGELGKDALMVWASQQYFHLLTLPNCFAALYARLPLSVWKEKQGLVRVLQGEVPHSDTHSSHYALFESLARHLGVDLDSLRKEGPAPYTKTFIDRRMDLCLSEKHPVEKGLAGIGWGNEVVNLYLFDAYRKGFLSNLHLKGAPMEYVRAHLDEEGPDSLVFQELLERLREEGASPDIMREGILSMLEWRMAYFDGLWDAIKGYH